MYKQLFATFIAISIISISCIKESVSGDEDIIKHPILWQKHCGHQYSYFTTPLIDNNNNIFVLTDNHEQSGEEEKLSTIWSFENDGTLRWKKELIGFKQSTLFYSNEKLFIILNDNDSSNISKLFVLNTTNGAINSTKAIASNNILLSISNQFLYLFYNSTLFKLSSDLEEIWQIEVNINIEEINVSEENIYLSSKQEIIKYKDQGALCEYSWSWMDNNITDISDVQIDHSNNTFIMSSGRINKISQEGHALIEIQLSPEIKLPESSFRLTYDDNLIIGADKLYKFDSEGNSLWSFKGEGLYSGNYQEFNISKDGYIYCGQVFGIQAITEHGESAWHIGVYQNISQQHTPVIDNEGNLIYYSPEHSKIICIKGDEF
jgi:hypothetical protein